MGNRNFRDMTDFPRGRADARIICGGCQRVVRLSGLDAARLYGPISRTAAEAKSRCRVCGYRGARIFPVPGD